MAEMSMRWSRQARPCGLTAYKRLQKQAVGEVAAAQLAETGEKSL
jgi:hypothetical protein